MVFDHCSSAANNDGSLHKWKSNPRGQMLLAMYLNGKNHIECNYYMADSHGSWLANDVCSFDSRIPRCIEPKTKLKNASFTSRCVQNGRSKLWKRSRPNWNIKNFLATNSQWYNRFSIIICTLNHTLRRPIESKIFPHFHGCKRQFCPILPILLFTHEFQPFTTRRP